MTCTTYAPCNLEHSEPCEENANEKNAGLGMAPMEAAEHLEWYRAMPSSAPVEEGGSGTYESPRHGTWNHDIKIAVFNNHVIVRWKNHAAEKPDDAACHPPARRTNLYGAANPAAGELPGGSAFIVGNSPNEETIQYRERLSSC